MAAFNERGIGILYLSKRQRIERVVLCAYKLKMLRKPFLAVGYELFVVWTWHGDVKVIVPWNETLVTNRTYHCAATDAVAQAMFFTNLV